MGHYVNFYVPIYQGLDNFKTSVQSDMTLPAIAFMGGGRGLGALRGLTSVFFSMRFFLNVIYFLITVIMAST